jgi:hypothetical protein
MNRNVQHLVKKWSRLLKGVEKEGQVVLENTAILLENQARAMIAEALHEGRQITEATTVGNLGTFQKFSFPLIRRVFPPLIANKIIGVQPMQGPVSQVFYLGYARHYGSTKHQVYSKHNLTYGNFVAGENGNVAGLDVSSDAAGAGNKYLSSVTATGEFTGASATVGGKIAYWPSSGGYIGAPWNVSAGEALTGTGIPEITFTIEHQSVQSRTRKFRALWTIEATQDLRAYHNLDLEKELTGLLQNEVRLEIDRELVEDIRNIAYDLAANNGFNRNVFDNSTSNNFPTDGIDFTPGGYTYAQGTMPGSTAGTLRNVFLTDFASSSLGLAPRHVGQVYANLIAVVQFASQDIYKSTLRGPANWVVCSPFVAAMLHSASKLEGGAPAGDAGTLGSNILYKGKWMGQFDVYVDPLYPEDEILLGYKGSSNVDAGMIYCPYIPLQMLPTIVNPEDFQPRKGLLTRYGKVAITPEARFYRVIRIIGASSNYLIAPFAKALR